MYFLMGKLELHGAEDDVLSQEAEALMDALSLTSNVTLTGHRPFFQKDDDWSRSP